MKVRPSFVRLLPSLLIIIFLGAGLIFGLTFNLFVFTFPYDWRQFAIIGIWLALSITLIILTITTGYYEVQKKYVIVHKGMKKLIYYYSDVVYIDEEQSEKKKMVHFFTKQGHVRYLTFDRGGILYNTMIANCKNRISKEEFQMKYPKVKI